MKFMLFSGTFLNLYARNISDLITVKNHNVGICNHRVVFKRFLIIGLALGPFKKVIF